MIHHVQSNIYNIISRLLSRNLQAKKRWGDVFKVLKKKKKAEQTKKFITFIH